MALFELPILDLKTEKCRIGDTYKLFFDVKYKALNIEKKVIEYLVERTDKFEVEDSYYDPETGQLVLTCKVLKNPLPFLVVFGIIVAGSTAFLAMLGITLTKVHKIIDAPTGKILTYTIAGIVAFLISIKLIKAIR